MARTVERYRAAESATCAGDRDHAAGKLRRADHMIAWIKHRGASPSSVSPSPA
jgi:hypothetical protein